MTSMRFSPDAYSRTRDERLLYPTVNAPRLLLLPGLDGTGDLFDPFVDALASDVSSTVLRYTSPPLSSYSDCRAAVLARLPSDGSYLLVGESFSGPIAIAIAAMRPPGLRGLVLVGSFVSSPRRMLRWLRPCIRFLPTHNAPRWMTDFLLLGRSAAPELRKRVGDAMAQITPAVVRARLHEIALTDSSEDLRKIDVPILYLRASRDRLVPRSCADRIARLRPGTRIVDIEAPHLLLQCAPRECAQVIGDFARECCAGSRGATAL